VEIGLLRVSPTRPRLRYEDRRCQEAKRPETRARRVGEAAAMIAAGKKWR